MPYELIPLLVFLAVLLMAGIALIADAGFRLLREIQIALRERER
jgi:hypothetical protein